MSARNTRPYALDVITNNALAFDIAEALGLLEESPALSVSLFEAGPEKMQVQALYESLPHAETAATKIGHTANVYQMPDTDWVSKTQSGLSPVPAGRFFVHGSHDSENIPTGTEHPILIDAGMAFGTGHHGTTKGCLIILDELLSSDFKPKTILDLGTGAGILAIAAAMARPSSLILASDIDPDAVEVAQQNAALNGVKDSLSIFQADGFDAAQLSGKQFDLIFANILAGPLMGLASEIYQATSKNGCVILSGILSEQAEEVSDKFRHTGFTVEPKATLEGWTSLLGTKL